MVEKFLSRTVFTSQEDYIRNFRIRVPADFNFAYDVVDAYAAEEPDKKALLWTDDRGGEIQFTFADMKRETDRTATYFQSLGIGRGDMVMLILKRRYEFWFSILALHKLGAVAIPATHLLTRKDVVYRCNMAGIKAIVAAGEPVITGHIAAAMPESPTTKLLISVGPEVPEGFLDFHEGIRHAAPFVRPQHVNTNDDIMLMYFTSGTTGEPKMVAHDFTYPLGHISTGCFWHNLHEGSLHLTIADTGWAKAAWGKLYGQWLAGANIFVYDHEKFTPADILRKIGQYRITSLCAPPTIYRFLIREDLSKYDLSSLEYCTTAGEALNGAVYDTFKRLTGVRLMEGFGQTETTLTLATFPWMEPKPGSMGVPNPQYDIDLLTPDGRSAEDGEQGQIVIRTDRGKPLGLFKEYYLNDGMMHEVWHDGVYYTGDVAWRDEDGYFWFVGRADDVIKSSGYRIGPFEVESALMTHPAVVECAITGVPDEIRGQVVKATIILGDKYRPRAGEELIRELQDHVKQITAPYKYPRIIEFVDELPKTISGKIRRKAIRADDENR
ncbi:acetyl-CoA synthetase [Alistipes onderdonkii subsp. vulgaris]|uniref:Acetyl-CoA synthetase n=1 Tax=Alistipes onderdonkii subsp. vulgaris TaxID=2585117 RepID=A0ACA8QUF4_9BACT|nr:AMP-binding protein [Alistipes onderdonkii]BBL08447.1 acetyl-CoA synthetase [Alistipes onderdonkii subsp. vulgaris]BBL11239.1 acetyl-CoA synthetase [Alistipes onderdonkii subsp. vulgaris]